MNRFFGNTQWISDSEGRKRDEKQKEREKRKKKSFVYKWEKEQKWLIEYCQKWLKIIYFYMSKHIRFPPRFPPWPRPSFAEDLPPLVLFPFLFFRPFRSLRVRSFYKQKMNDFIFDVSNEHNLSVHAYVFSYFSYKCIERFFDTLPSFRGCLNEWHWQWGGKVFCIR